MFIFFGTSRFAAIILAELLQLKFPIGMLVTQPDAPVGKKKILTSSPAKVVALSFNIPVYEPVTFKSLKAEEILKSKNPELFIVASYGKILPESILKIPSKGCLNVHPSRLPQYRGSSPLQWAILNGDKDTAVSIIKMDAKMDHGPIVAQENLEISPRETFLTLEEKAAHASAILLAKTIPGYLDGTIQPREQAHAQATFSKILSREDGHLDTQRSAHELDCQVRAFTPWPGSFIEITKSGKKIRVKILEAHAIPDTSTHPARSLYSHSGHLGLQCKIGSLILNKVHVEGKKEQTGKEFMNGYWDVLAT
ncbi:MAG: methionyl-tRNA formyltransferase [Parcubacteria group bacterium Gr01-1014_18]|nr:MAG: methionyl-tRNA formyltransferase [Parcubacteria group bacterium Greene0416_36]TSC81304.1 MAG: methionyl-tRNA formyltransferase [Parcubacteria group bacterium Gr01-1014_18]TSC99326.1 MAG: methionyl-tRNA formyltransferase [Parcubacteria group bacterium Greene1014_20]TSD06837.1 MAG: methionyl-tRNA formyltransferase [Parcubacteria group bacterium Greene0714_2]